MRNKATVEIEGQGTYTVRELTVRQVKEIFESEAPLMERAEYFLSQCSDVKAEDLLDMTPSELDILVNKFKEVNASFFKWARLIGAEAVVKEMLQKIPAILSCELASLSDQGTDRPSGITDGASS